MTRSGKLLSVAFAALLLVNCSQDPTGVSVSQRKSPDATHNLMKGDDEGYQSTGPIKKCSLKTGPKCDI